MTGPPPGPPPAMFPCLIMVRGRPAGRCNVAALPEMIALHRDAGDPYDAWHMFEGRWLIVEASDGRTWHRMPGRPVDDGPGSVRRFLHEIKAGPGVLPPAPPGAPCGQGRASADYRVHDEAHQCLRCGADPIGVAAVADTSAGPRWVDMCHRCCNWLRAGSAAAETEEFTARLDSLWGAGSAAEADTAWRELWRDYGGQL